MTKRRWRLLGSSLPILFLALVMGRGLDARDEEPVDFESAYRSGRFESALEIAERRFGDDPSAISWRYNRGLVRYRLGDLERALEDFRKVGQGAGDRRLLFRAAFNEGRVHWDLYRRQLRAKGVDRSSSVIEVNEQRDALAEASKELDPGIEAFCRALEAMPSDRQTSESLEALALERAWVEKQLQRASDPDSRNDDRSGEGTPRASSAFPDIFASPEGLSGERRLDVRTILERALSRSTEPSPSNVEKTVEKPW